MFSRDDFDKALSVLKAAIDARQAGDSKVSQARATESGARERFVSAHDSNIGAIRQLFPRQPSSEKCTSSWRNREEVLPQTIVLAHR